MARITRQSVDEVRMRADFVSLVGDYTTLKKSGSSWKGLSPFTSEKTPSFYVHPDKEFCYCFSTGQGGDIFRFLMLKEGLNFQEAVERVARRFNIEVKYESVADGRAAPSDRTLHTQLLAIHEAATAFYASAFRATDSVAAQTRDYWVQQRKFTQETASLFQIGFAPVNDGDLARFFSKKGFTKSALAASGLFTGTDYSPDPLRWHSKFRGRLMIPIRDAQGRVVAFTARLLPFMPVDERDPTRDAKYVNSPETEIFHKSQILFNLDKARLAAHGEDTPIVLVEGQLDAIRAYTCGVKTAVAGQGTAIGSEHMALLRRYSRRVDILLDADRAGRDAVLKLLPVAFRSGMEVRVLSVPGGKDPDEYLSGTGAEGWSAVLESATDAMTFATGLLLPASEARTRTNAQTLDALQKLFDIITESESAVVRDDLLRKVSRLTVLNESAVRRDFERHRLTSRRRRADAAGGGQGQSPAADGVASEGAAASSAIPGKPLNTVEETLLVLALNNAELANELANVLDTAWLDKSTAAGQLLDRMLAEILEGQWTGTAMIRELATNDEETNLVARLLVEFSSDRQDDDAQTAQWWEQDPKRLANECLSRMLKRQMDTLTGQLAALPDNATEERTKLMAGRARLRGRIGAPLLG